MVLLDLSGVDSKKVLATLEEPCAGGPRKRRRLDDLTPEERILRRKLKNRVAAQTARDRKKARMSELEEIVEDIEKENEVLKISNEELRAKLQMVAEENNRLKERLGMSPPTSTSDHVYAAPCPSEFSQMTKSSMASSLNTNQSVIKVEEASAEYAEEMADSSSVFDHALVAQLEPEEIINITEQTNEESEMAEIVTHVPIKTEEPESDIEDSLSPFTESSPSSPDSGIHGDTNDVMSFFGDLGSVVGDASLDEILASEEEVKNAASTLQPTLNEIAVDDMGWEDPFLDLFPTLMAV